MHAKEEELVLCKVFRVRLTERHFRPLKLLDIRYVIQQRRYVLMQYDEKFQFRVQQWLWSLA